VVALGFIIVEIFRPVPGLGAIVLPIPVLVQGYALNIFPVSNLFGILNSITATVGGKGAWFPPPTKEAEALMPALQSYWLEIHVITIFLAYGAFALSFGTVILYLWKNRNNNHVGDTPPIAGGSGADASILALENLDQHTYWLVALGFIMLGAGIIFGAVWANETWGSYWSWDPKETWSLITWFVYAVFLHMRLVSKWRGSKIAWLAVLGFIAVLLCYYGVNVIFPKYTEGGLHSYGSPE
jgi:cytochrome c-type biogenesis protein CcsB